MGTLLEDDQTARGWALQRRLADAEPVARGADSLIYVYLPVFLGGEGGRARCPRRPKAGDLRTACYWASLFADEWHPTKTVERLKLGAEFLKAHDHNAQARTVKEEAFQLRRDELSWVIDRLEAQARGWPND